MDEGGVNIYIIRFPRYLILAPPFTNPAAILQHNVSELTYSLLVDVSARANALRNLMLRFILLS
jgi:hypothetical protein